MSSSSPLIREILTPSAGVISYSVMVGPTVALIDFIWTPNVAKTSTMRFLFASCSFSSTYTFPPSSYFLSRSSVGYLYFVQGSFGFIGVVKSILPTTVLLAAFSSVSPTVISISGSFALPVLLESCLLVPPFISVLTGVCTSIPSSVKSTVWGAGSSYTFILFSSCSSSSLIISSVFFFRFVIVNFTLSER